jgi:hypothetical protein
MGHRSPHTGELGPSKGERFRQYLTISSGPVEYTRCLIE